jgi:hypothetical protein
MVHAELVVGCLEDSIPTNSKERKNTKSPMAQ